MILVDQLVWLASGRRAGKPEEAQANSQSLNALLAIGITEIVDVCTGVCREEITALHLATDSQASSQRGSQGLAKQLEWVNEDEVAVQDYCKQMINLQKVFASKGYMNPPQDSRKSPTSSASTQQDIDAPEKQHICWLAELVGCKSLDDVDQDGWNLRHHLFQCMSASILACNIVENMASSRFAKLKANMRRAVQQKTTGSMPIGCTPVHLLCTNSDTDFMEK